MSLNDENTLARDARPAVHNHNVYNFIYFWNTRYEKYLTDVRLGFRSVNTDFDAAIFKLRTSIDPVNSFNIRDAFSIKYMGSMYQYNPQVDSIIQQLGRTQPTEIGISNIAWIGSDVQRNTVLSELERVRDQYSFCQEMKEGFYWNRKINDQNTIKQNMGLENIINN